jgi:hypothetical protein
MVTGADVVLADPTGSRGGTRFTMRVATAAGVRVLDLSDPDTVAGVLLRLGIAKGPAEARPMLDTRTV